MYTDAASPRVDEIADGIYRVSSYLAPFDISVNQFLVLADEPLLFHLGFRSSFASVCGAISGIIDPRRLRWLSFGHVEADECGALNQWLSTAPSARVAFNPLGCMLSLDDMADRLPHELDDGEALDLGGRRILLLRTAHAPHNWEAQVLYEETTRTLLCGDLCASAGTGPAITDDGDRFVEAAVQAETTMPASPPGPAVPDALRRLAELHPRVLAVMHGTSFHGDGDSVLRSIAAAWEARFGVPAPNDLSDETGEQLSTHQEART
jgi:flavorubredoxin